MTRLFDKIPRPEIKVAYDHKPKRGREQRLIKVFKNPYDARRFWTLKDKQGMKPKIIGDRDVKTTDTSGN